MNRKQQIENAQNKHYDICIIGGGITGAGILYHAINNGYKTLLLEREDFAFGTSSRSSKMIHGGLRYLKNFQLKFVREALHEREHLLQEFPHLVKPIKYILPSYNSKLNWYKNRIGLTLYDILAGKTSLPKHHTLTTQEVLKYLPNFNAKNLMGGVAYWDAQTNDAKLVLDVISNCNLKGTNAINYCGVTGINKSGNNIKNIECTDTLTQTKFNVNASVYINATGVWTDELLLQFSLKKTAVMKPSKGIHVIVSTDIMPKETVVLVESSENDGRFLYNLPWENNLSILGTTDSNYTKHPNEVSTKKEDIDYILNAFNKSFPAANITYKDIISVYAGLRPMLADEHTSSYEQSREYKIWWNTENMLTIAGGKLTSFLSMGKHCIDVVNKKNIPATSSSKPSQKNNSPWQKVYGDMGYLIDKIILEDAQNSILFTPTFKYTNAEILFFIRYQSAETIDDIFTRRTHITYSMQKFNIELVQQLATFMAKELNKTNDWIQQQIELYKHCWAQYHPDFIQ
ncbi:MAG: glycerol-3-phosphate dehydrogenase/oxidase [Chitinophagales bacterium]|nr:glycerol-3-phosphate dehydrogenase/oxidase [Chitinophagales bacterium]